MNPWIWLLAGPLLLVGDVADAAEEHPPFVEAARSDKYRPEHGTIRAVNGRLVFSQYAKSGNAFDVVSLDPDTQTPDFVVTERKGARLVTKDDRFLVLQQQVGFTNPVVVLDIVSQAELGRIRLRQMATWGQIRGDRLLIVQGFLGGYSATAPALIYSLPKLKLLRSTTIAGGNGVDVWRNHIVSLGREVTIYDDKFESIGSLALPKPRTDRNVSCGASGPLRIWQEKAVVVANCGDIHVFDLKTRALERIIPAFSHFYEADVIDGVLFAAALDLGQEKNTRAFEIATGDLLSVLPIDASSGLYAIGSRLMALHPVGSVYGPKAIVTFAMDLPALRKGGWPTSRVVKVGEQAHAMVTR